MQSISKTVLLILKVLTFRASGEDFAALNRAHLAAGLLITWLVGMGRYWDNPRVGLLQHAGIGSVVYVFVLAGLLWILGLGLRPQRWGYLNLLIFITLTAPPGLLYAIPVEKFMTPSGAQTANLWFLALVAAWRVALYVQYLVRYARFSIGPLIVQLLLPLTLIVTVLTFLNLEKAVFDMMGGLQQTQHTSADAAYEALIAVTLYSLLLFPFLVIAYAVLAIRQRLRRKTT
jgi:hypothetical protein